jgi:hypothetical protein
MLTRESLSGIFDELGKTDRIIAVFTGLVPPYSIGVVDIDDFGYRLMLLVDLGCRHSWICSKAALVGSLECLEYAHTHGCPWNSRTCMLASRAGSLAFRTKPV